MVLSYLFTLSLAQQTALAATSVTFYTDDSCREDPRVANVTPSIFNDVQCQAFPLQGTAVGSALLTDWDSATTGLVFQQTAHRLLNNNNRFLSSNAVQCSWLHWL